MRRLTQVDRGGGGSLFASDQFGLRHVPRDRVRRIVKRELVPQSPGKHAKAEQHESDAEQMDTAAAGDGTA